MKKMELPEMMFVEMAAGDVIATSDDRPYCDAVCEVECENWTMTYGCRSYCDWYCEEEDIGYLYCDFLTT